jgi:hypothetical protein
LRPELKISIILSVGKASTFIYNNLYSDNSHTYEIEN